MPESRLPNGESRASGCVLACNDIRNLDRFTIDHGIASIDLMERAGIELSASLLRLVDETARVLVLAGSGNNGGDGYVIARLLRTEGLSVTVAHIGRPPHEGSECDINAERWSAMGGTTLDLQAALAALAEPDGLDLIVDTLFGTGLDRAIEGDAAEIIAAANATTTAVFAVDIPSGLDADAGRALGPCIRADLTATIGSAKPGLFLADGPQWCGRVEVLDIGLATPRNAGIATMGCVLDARAVAPLLPRFERTIHKGNRGHVLIAGGAVGKSGAAVLAARAALRAGAGLVTVGVPASIAGAVDAMLPEAMTLALADDGEGRLGRDAWQAVEAAGIDFDVLAAGPGMGEGEGADLFVGEALQHFDGPIIFDADALNVLADGPPDLRTRLARRRAREDRRVVLTPHPGEMARLVASDSASVQSDRAGIARAFAKSHEAVLLLKGAGSIVAEGGRLAYNTSGNPGMAAAGMGDVLTGVTAALCARIRPVFDAACAAAYIHGKAGDLAAARIGSSGYLSGEVADLVPAVIDWLQHTGGKQPFTT